MGKADIEAFQELIWGRFYGVNRTATEIYLSHRLLYR